MPLSASNVADRHATGGIAIHTRLRASRKHRRKSEMERIVYFRVAQASPHRVASSNHDSLSPKPSATKLVSVSIEMMRHTHHGGRSGRCQHFHLASRVPWDQHQPFIRKYHYLLHTETATFQYLLASWTPSLPAYDRLWSHGADPGVVIFITIAVIIQHQHLATCELASSTLV